MFAGILRRLILSVVLVGAIIPFFAAETITPVAPDALMLHGVTYVPLRPLAQLIGGKLKWDAQLDVVCIERNGKRFACVPGHAATRQNRKPEPLVPSPFMHYGVTYVPLRPLVTALGGTVFATAAQDTLIVSFRDNKTNVRLPFINIANTPYHLFTQEVWVVNIDGTSLRRLTFDTVSDELPAFSPDGRWLANARNGSLFLRRSNEPYGVYVQQADNLVAGVTYNEPQFSPDGKVILFTKQTDTDAKNSEILRMNSDGSVPQVLAMNGALPHWSPRGDCIAYTDISNPQAPSIQVMDPQGGNRRTLGPGFAWAFSPDGQTILAVVLAECAENGDTHTMLKTYRVADGTALGIAQQGASVSESESPGTFSANSQWIVFSKPSVGIYLMHPDHSDERQLTQDISDSQPIFSPDGTAIIFLREQNIYSMHIDGTHLQQLTTDLLVNEFRLTPDGRKILLTAITPTVRDTHSMP